MYKEYLHVTLSCILLIFLFALLIGIQYLNPTITEYLISYNIPTPSYVIPTISALMCAIVAIRFGLQLLENSKLKHDFVTIVTHKFRTPLTGVKWALDNLKDDRLNMQERNDIIRSMNQGLDKILEIVDMMVGASQFDRRIGYVHEIASIRAMVETSLQKYSELIRKKNLTFQVDPGNSIPNLIIDKRKMQFAVDVIIQNAITYTPASGKIIISFTHQKGVVTLIIQDSGIGLGFFDRKRIFNQFYRTAEARRVDTEGMGLGLYTAKTIVEAHKGKLWAESKGKNKGTTFYMQLKTEL